MRVRPRHVLWILAALAVFVSALAAVAIWRLSQGPVNLALLAPRVEAALSRPEAGYRVEMEAVEVAWAGWNRLLRFKVSDARLVTLEGRPLVETKGLEFALSAGDVLTGRVVPREVELLGVSATVRRRTDGTIGLVAAANAETEGGPQEIDLDGLLAAGAAGGGDGFAGFGVRGAALTVVDDIMGMEWSVPRLDLAFRGDGGGGGTRKARRPCASERRKRISGSRCLRRETPAGRPFPPGCTDCAPRTLPDSTPCWRCSAI